MAAVVDATAITEQLLERTHMLRRALDGGADFGVMASVADEIAEFADGLAAMFDEIDEILTRSSLVSISSEARTSPLEQPSNAQPSDALPSAEEGEPPPEPRRRRLAAFFRPARWLGRRVREIWQALGWKAPSERPEFS
jgi:hypothetical protein